MGDLNAAFPAIDNAVSLGKLGAVTGTGNIETSILDNEKAAFKGAVKNVGIENNQVLTYGTLFSRNLSLNQVSDNLTKINKKAKNGSKETNIRQGEINEWQAANKLDTLFFLQILFVYLCILVIAVFLRQYGLFSNTIVYIVAGVFGLIVVGVLWNRASYTSTSRDKRYWNRRFIGLDDAGKGLSSKLRCG